MANIGAFAIIFDDRQHVLCVRTAYGKRRWTTPGGRVEPGESPLDALVREVREESGLLIAPGELIGVYAKPWEDDLALSFAAQVLGREDWQPDEEIGEIGYFSPRDLPRPMTIAARTRILDGADGLRGILRVFRDAYDNPRA